MRKALIVSFALHTTVLVWALVELPFAREFDVDEVPSLPIDIVTPAEFTKIKAGTKDAKKEEPTAKEKPVEKPSEAKKEKPKEVEAARAPAPAPAPEPEPKQAEKPPEPKPELKKAEEPKPEPKPKETAESPPPPSPKRAPPKPKTAFKEPLKPEKPKKVADRKPEQKKSDFNADRIAALLNKVPDAGPKTAPSVEEPQAKPEPPARGQSSGQDLTMSVSELDALRAKISQCWIPPVGGMGAEQIKVRLRIQLNPDGTLLRQPEIVNRQSSPFFQVAADSAVRAVWQCQPYELSAEKYALWRDMILNFDPREMFGG